MTEREQRETVVAEAMSWLGTPWRHAAKHKGVGVDCGQLVLAAYAVIGVVEELPPYRQDWALHNSRELMRETVEHQCRLVTERDPLPGEIVLFKYGRCLSHSGIVVAWPSIVHAFIFVGRVVVDNVSMNSGLVNRYGGCWSFWER